MALTQRAAQRGRLSPLVPSPIADEPCDLGDRLTCRLRRLRLVTPLPTKKLATVFGDHSGYAHDPHDKENRKEHNCNHEDWHTAPLTLFCGGVEPASVMAITGGCELRLGQGNDQPAKRSRLCAGGGFRLEENESWRMPASSTGTRRVGSRGRRESAAAA